MTENDLFTRLAQDSRIALEAADLEKILEQGACETGGAEAQVSDFCQQVGQLTEHYPEALSLKPESIL